MLKRFFVLLLAACPLCLHSCSSSSELSDCNPVGGRTDICLVFDNDPALAQHKPLIQELISEAFGQINAKMPIDNLTIEIVANAQQTIPEIGIGGFNPSTEKIIIYINPNFANLVASMEKELGPQLAHEIHHAKRRRSVGYGNTLLQAMVSEGLADHFSIEVFGIDPPLWSIALEEAELQQWIATASETWNESGYNHSTWFFGTTSEVPRWAGYSIGFELVKKYLEANPTERPSNLHDEVAASFEP
ncbi:DUF2268 domain-containing putative Zn-dependent protease [Flagellimonas lutaonensis]|uniref:DUF2268 domain-containing protein n=1 Tax=Flagellimonas lutaonensis TaxID=516051 RepID=A0A0D5YSA2_9FLAO|nr:DUF2268 domain-containing putative Zn-dependent protease [Allomuricauda lutaonensis]AKA35140.1 hypothetical protein VC82_1520 [Allomuricauda lutaonensis]